MQSLVSAKVFFEMANDHFFLAKVLAKVHVDMSKFALYIVNICKCIYCLLCMFHFVKPIG